jgi:hypothetical protein
MKKRKEKNCHAMDKAGKNNKGQAKKYPKFVRVPGS